MAATTKSKAQERFVNLQKRDQAVRRDIEIADRIRSEKVAKLRELRLAKEAEEAKDAEEAKTQKKTAPANKAEALTARKGKSRSASQADASKQ